MKFFVLRTRLLMVVLKILGWREDAKVEGEVPSPGIVERPSPGVRCLKLASLK
jgi:hypothetical protein